MLLVMTHYGDANGALDFAEKKMVRETMQVDAPPARRLEVKTARTGGGFFDERIQFRSELIAQPFVDAVVMAKDFGNVFLNVRVIHHLHRWRFACTRRTNSSWEIGATLPEASS